MNNLDDALPRYLSILKGEREPKFRKIKRIGIDFDPLDELSTLMDIHRETMKNGEAVKTGKPNQSLLDLKLAIADKILRECHLCEKRCGVDRYNGRKGRCGVLEARISSEFLHYGEEPELIPSYTIFFSGCTFECVYCQNNDISQYPSSGEHFAPEVIVELISSREGVARNVNWVGGDPTSNLSYILEVLTMSDTNLPQVWNSNMYLTETTLELLDGVIDVYLTDFKYGNERCAKRLSKIDNYWNIITRNHLLAREQAEVIIRHLVLPEHVECCSKPILDWIAGNMQNVRVNVMPQYRPMYQASEYPEINRSLKTLEFLEAKTHAQSLDLNLVE